MIQARYLLLSLAIVTLPVLAGCSSSSTTPTHPATPSFVYYSLDNAGPPSTELGLVAYPITATSTLATTLLGSAANGLHSTLNMAFDTSGRLFVVNDGPPPTISVFTPPLTATSAATFILTLPASFVGGGGIAFDAAGNLWATDFGTHIAEFNGPFTTSATLVANVTIISPPSPFGITFDASGNLWVALQQPTNGIAEFLKGSGFTNATPLDHTLTGASNPRSVIFDKAGNLFSSGDLAAQGIAEWNASNLAAGATPNVFDHTGMNVGFAPWQLTFDTLGNLYVADCGTTAAIYVFPTATTALSGTLAPVVYSDANIVSANCVKGVAIH